LEGVKVQATNAPVHSRSIGEEEGFTVSSHVSGREALEGNEDGGQYWRNERTVHGRSRRTCYFMSSENFPTVFSFTPHCRGGVRAAGVAGSTLFPKASRGPG